MTTGHIGRLGTARESVAMTFDYFGLVIRVHPDASDLELVEFMMAAADIGEVDEVQGMLALSKYLRGLVHPDDWQAFWQASKGNRQNLQDLMTTAQSIVEAVANFPTGQHGDSSPGRTSTVRKSTGGRSSRARRARGGGPTPSDTKAALTLLQGRPDLKATVALAAEAAAS